nr:MAG TPA: portal [Caudoviricetes sp.]
MGFIDKVKNLLKGNETEPTQTDEAEVTASGRVLDDHPSAKITPSKLKQILEDAENGDIQAQHQLFMDIEEQDSSIAANMMTRKRSVLTLDWRIVEPRNATPAEEKLQAEIDELFYQYPNLEDLFVDLMDAVGHGFSALEIQWAQVNGKWVPKGFKPCPQSWFKLDKDDSLLLRTPANQMGEPLRPFGWVVHRHKSRSTQLARDGLYRTLAWLYMYKHYSVRDFAEFLELYGMPIRIGKYGAGATNAEKRTLLRALAEIGHNAAGIMPESMQIELHNVANAGAASGNNPFLQMVDWCEKSIARLILGQTLTSGADGKSSTNALGNVHNEVRRDLMISDAKQIAQTITQQIILPYLQINVDPNIAPHRVPYFEFDTKEYEDLSVFADAIPKLTGIGVQISESWVRDKLGIPEPQEGELILSTLQGKKTDKKTTALSAVFNHGEGCACGCRSAALSAQNGKKDEQDELDGLIDDALANADFNQQLDPMMKQIVGVVMASESYDEAQEKLIALYPDLTSESHQAYLTSAVFLADLLGAANAERT